MPFDAIRGQDTPIETLSRALGAGLVHHAYRFEGIDGIGKRSTAMAFAKALCCDTGDPLGCGRCDHCRRAGQLCDRAPFVPLHPDVIFVGRGIYAPDMIGGSREAKEISVEQVRRVVISRAAYPPHEGRAQVFIVHHAHELSVSAANALLKTLEEPRPATYFVLITSQPERLLDTIRSRSLPLRFGPLPDDVMADLLRDHGVADHLIADLIDLAGGSIAAALSAADAEQASERDQFVRAVREAVAASDLGAGVALGESASRDRSSLMADLRTLAGSYVREARAAVRDDPPRAELSARRHELVLDAIDAIERNGAATLTLASLVASLRHGFQRRPGTKPPIIVQRR